MVEQRKINWAKLLLAFLIAVFLFCFGLFLGFIARGFVEQSTLDLEEGIRNDILGLETLSLIEKQYPCNTKLLDLTSEKLDYLGELISLLEAKKSVNAEEVLELKKLYTALEMRHYLIIENRKIKCENDYDTVLFFYSNDETCTGEVEKSAFILSFLRKKYEDTVRVYSFDINLDSEIITILKDQYKVESCSAIILNEEKISFKPKDSSELEDFLKN